MPNTTNNAIGNIVINGAHLIFRNFQGRKTEFNEEGNRNFGLLLDDVGMAEQLVEEGWNVKYLSPFEEGDAPQPWLPVKVKFGKIPPNAVLLTGRGKIKLDENTIEQLDWTRAANIDLIVRPYNYPEFRGRPAGIAAYLKSIYVTVQEDELELKYADIPFIDETDPMPFG